jgi:hypothetical protein
MRQIFLFVSVVTLMLGTMSCYGQTNKKENAQAIKTLNINVYYFHFTHRCSTCLAVEENARKAVEELYPGEVKAGTYTFTSINLDEAKFKELADKLGVGGQTLLVVRGEKKIDITSEGFMNANDLDKIKAEIKSTIEKILL